MRTLLSVVLFTAVLSAQVTPQEAQRQKDLCKAGGQLFNSVTNEPVRKAKVTLRPSDPGKTVMTVSSDSEGKFLLENIDPGRYTLSAERQGFVNQNYGATRAMGPGSVIDLQPGRTVAELIVKLIPQGVIAGKVLDDEGEPMSGLTVMALRYAYVGGHRHLVPASGGMPIQTNDLGEYRISNLAPDRYYVETAAQKMMNLQMGLEKQQSKAPEEGYIPVFFPNSPDAASASPVDVGPGAEVRGIDLRLKKARVQRISGKMLNATTGEPVKAGILMVYRREKGGMSVVPSSMFMVQGARGEFELRDVPAGSYSLLAMVTGDPQNMMLSMSNLEVGDHAIEGMTVSVGGGADIPLTVRFADGVTPPVKPDPAWDLSNIRVVLQIDDNPLASLATTQMAKDHTGVLKHVNPDKYKLVVMGIPPGLYLKSAGMAGQEVLENGLDVRNGVNGTLDLVIGSPASELTGSVKNEKGEPVKQALVTLIAKNAKGRTDLARNATTDQNGQFNIKGIVPAEYKVFAWEDIEQGAADDEEFRKPFDKRGADVDLSKGVSGAAVPLVIISKAAIEEEKSKK